MRRGALGTGCLTGSHMGAWMPAVACVYAQASLHASLAHNLCSHSCHAATYIFKSAADISHAQATT